MKKFGLHIVFCLLFLTSWGQDPYVELILEPEEVEVGQPVRVVIKANMDGDINLDFPKEFKQGANVQKGIRQEYDHQTKQFVTFIFSSRSGSFCKPGNYTVGPAFVRKGNKVYKSNSVSIKVNSYSGTGSRCAKSKMRKRAFGQIELATKEVFEGEPIICKAKIYSTFQPEKFYDYSEFNPLEAAENVELKDLNETTVAVEKVNGENRFAFELDNRLIFAKHSGRMIIDPFLITVRSIDGDSYPVSSDRTVVKVKPLPKDAPAEFYGAVGEYEIKRKIIEAPSQAGGILSVAYTLVGKGNLHDVDPIKIDLPDGFSVYGDPEIKEDFHFSRNGAVGQLTAIYHIQISNAGKVELPPLKYAYFDPKDKAYKTLEMPAYEMILEPAPGQVPAATVDRRSTRETVDPVLDESESSPWYFSTTAKLIGGGLPVLAFLFLMVMRNKRKEESTEIELVEESAPKPKFDADKAIRGLLYHQNNEDYIGYFNLLNEDLNKAMSIQAGWEEGTVLTAADKNRHYQSNGFSAAKVEQIEQLFQVCQSVKYGQQKPIEPLSTFTKQAREAFNTLGA